MDQHRDWVKLDEISRLEGLPYKTVERRLHRAHATHMNDPEDGRGRLYAITVLSPQARDKWLSEQGSLAPQNSAFEIPHSELPTSQRPEQTGGPEAQGRAMGHGRRDTGPESPAPSPAPSACVAIAPVAARSLQPGLPFAPPSPSEEARAEAVAAVPAKERKYVDGWLAILADHRNGTWKRYSGTEYGGFAIRTREDFMRAQARLLRISERSIYAKLRTARIIFKDPSVPETKKWMTVAEAYRPKNRPGRSSAAFFVQEENAWMWPELRRIYLNQARFSKEATYQILMEVIEQKQKVWGLGHFYARPTKWQVFTALEKIPQPEEVMGRQGEKAFNDQCSVYISRNPATLQANDLWVTDQKEIDVRMRDGGEHLGRIWMVNFLDVASDKVLGFAFGPVLSSDMVMMAATMAIERCGVPKAIHMDLGKEFICKAFNGTTRKFSGEVLYKEALGLWKSLDVERVKTIGRNAQSKTIERWHANLPGFDRRFPGYCGSSPDSRPEKLAEEEAQHLAWLADKTGKMPRTPLVTISQYIHAYINWVETEWNAQARGRGKMRRGMTPNEAFNVKRPPNGFRLISLDELDHHSAEHRFVKIARGGQINLTFFGQTIEYTSPELFLHQGEDCEVIISRRTFRSITVIYPVSGGTARCVATLKPQLAWLPENREELRAAMRCKAAVHRAIRQGVKASRVALEAANPVDLLEQQKALPAKDIIGAQKFFGEASGAGHQAPGKPEPPLGHPETGSVEYTARRSRTASDIADRWEEEGN